MSNATDLSELIKGTSANFVTETDVMHGRSKIETPLLALNCILGGGVPLGCIVEAYGSPTSGKSSMWYQTMGEFQKKFPEGIGIIVDTEASVDGTRMKFMGCDPKRVLRIPATTLEEGFEQVFKILKKKASSKDLIDVPVFVLWDTIGVNPSRKQFDTGDLYGGGMMDKSRIIKHNLSIMLPYIEEQPLLVVLLNQVTTEVSKYGSKLTSGGGWGIKHNAHLRLLYESGKTDYDGIFATTKHSSLSIEKSKLSPLFRDIPMCIDITKGGIVDTSKSMIKYVTSQLNLLESGSWYSANKLAEKYPQYVGRFDKFLEPKSKFRLSELEDYCKANPDYLTLLSIAFIDDISARYTYQSEVCHEYYLSLVKKLSDN